MKLLRVVTLIGLAVKSSRALAHEDSSTEPTVLMPEEGGELKVRVRNDNWSLR
jgi:hypothetical protein